MSKRFSKLFSFVTILALILMAAPIQSAQAATPSELFFSEYIEGSSLNKALEIYNGTGAPVDLAAGSYSIEIYFNGSTSAGTTIALSGTIADGDVFVVADDGSDPAILAETDQTSTSSFFNGDDAILLLKGGVIVDAIGQVGIDPGSEWTGGGADDTLRRMATVCAGDTNPSDSFDFSVEWNSFAQNTFDGLGTHTSNCDGGGSTPGQTLPLTENFDDCTLAGWEIISVDADAANTWACNASFSNIDANGYGDTASANEWLITPALNLDAQTGDTLSFRNFTNFSDINYPQLHVLYSTDYDGGGDPTSASWTELTGINFSPEDSNSWVDSGNIDLSGISGTNVYFAFQYVSSGTGSGSAANWRLDAINFFEYIPPSLGGWAINEIRIDQPGSDNDEYFEIAADPGASLDGLTYLVIGDGSGGSGVIENVTDLTGNTVPASGYFVAAESTFKLGTADLITSLNFENSDNVTHLLVRDFSGSNGQDLDTNDDGVLDVTPWSELVDLIALVEEENPPSGTEYHYGPPSVGPDGSFVPGHAFSCLGGWLIGPFDPVGGDDTPGAKNDCPPPVIVINEIMQNPSAVFDSAGEWVELYNPLGYDVDINGWTILDNDFDSHVISNGGPLLVPAGGYLVLGNNADQGTNGGVPVDYQYSGYFLSNSADEVVLLDEDLVEIDRVEYDGGSAFPDPNGASMQLKDADLDNNVGANWCEGNTSFGSGDLGTPGAANICDVFIHEVQGAGAESPLEGSIVAIEGIVVGDFQDNLGANGDLNGFFVQEEDADADSDPLTSEGIFVYQGSNPTVDLVIGDLVRVEGSVSEFNGMTEITSFSGVSVLSSGNPLPTASVLSLPVTAVDDFEAYEGMYVTFPQALVISEYFNFDRFGEIVLTSERHLTPTAEFEPGPDAVAAANAFLLDRITLDDGRTSQNPDPAIHPNGGIFDLTNLFRGGDTVANVTGVINYDFGLYRVQPTQGADYTNTNMRTTSPDPVDGNLKIASFNVLNYFTTLDNGSCPYSGGCRGADDADEFTRQRDKIIAALAEIDADVVGLLEIENHPSDVSTADLVSGLNAVLGTDTYAYVSTGTIGTDAIKVALIYKPTSVSLIGDYAILDSSVDTRFIDTKNRPTLAQTFMNNSTGGVFTVAVNHLKSKGSACDDVGDPDTGDGSGNCNLTRKAAAEAMVDWLASDPTGSGDDDFLIIGDLNSYDKEDPIDAILAGGYTDMIYAYHGEDAYSYVFDGQIGYLDYALASADLIGEATGITEWHINADEPDLIDYDTSFKGPNQDAIYNADPYRSSDHDPVIIGLELTTAAEIQELIDDVQKLVDDGVLNGGQGNALITKLEHALEKLADGKPGVAANQLGAFINQVEDFVYEGVLTSEQGDLLINAASLLVGVLDG